MAEFLVYLLTIFSCDINDLDYFFNGADLYVEELLNDNGCTT